MSAFEHLVQQVVNVSFTTPNLDLNVAREN
jgi:hypothetical protein